MALNFANNNSLSAITTKPSGLSGSAMNLISTQTASSSSTISFTSGIDSTYDSYVFKFYNIHPSGDDVVFSFQASTDGGSNYNTTATTTFFRGLHNESDSASTVEYGTSHDEAQTTGIIDVDASIGGDADQHACGTMQIFNPSSTTFVKHFIYNGVSVSSGDYAVDTYTAGYFNTTSVINAIQFKFASGNIDSGVIKLYGIS
nr:hypothetical protein [uncultured Mediterranean phage uvMED]